MVVTLVCDRCEKIIGEDEYWRIEIVKANKNGLVPRTDTKNDLCDSCQGDYRQWLKMEGPTPRAKEAQDEG